jgi:hypothetical protein
MILGFKKIYVESILHETKIHTIRWGKRWQPNMAIQFYASPRTKQMYKFREDGIVRSVQDIEIEFNRNPIDSICHIDGRRLSILEMDRFAKNDGFRNFWEFAYAMDHENVGIFEGQIVHWTDFRYWEEGADQCAQ